MSTMGIVNELEKRGSELVGEWAKNTCSIAKKAQGGCSSCNRNGDIVILPIRYSAAHRDTAQGCLLPPEEISRFTDIVPKEDSSVRYVYRKLRKGFLYVYDDHPQLPIWQCYMVSERGELTEFSINNNVSLDDIENIKCTDNSCSSWSSLVSIRDIGVVRKIYFVYIEVPYSKKMLDYLSGSADRRNKIMQSFSVGSIESCKRAISLDSIRKFVLEYSESVDPYLLIRDQLYPGRFFGTDDKSNKDVYKNLYSYAIRKEDCSPRHSFALVVDDQIGMIEQLNHLRYMPFAEFSTNLLPGDVGDDSNNPGTSFNENNYKWYMSVNQLKEVMRKMTPVRDLNVSPSFKADWKGVEASSAKDMEKYAHDMTYEQVEAKRKNIQENNSPNTNAKFNGLIEEKTKKGENVDFIIRQKETEAQSEVMSGAHSVDFYKWKRVESFYKKQWMNSQFSESWDRYFLIQDFPSYYDNDAYENIGKKISKYRKRLDVDAPQFDAYICTVD